MRTRSYSAFLLIVLSLLLIPFSGYGADTITVEPRDDDETGITIETDSEEEAREGAERRDRSAEAAGIDRDTIGGLERADVDEVARRRRAINFTTAGFGPADLDNIGSEGVAYNFYLGRLWEVNPNAAIRTVAEAVTDFDDAVLLSGNLGLNLYPFNADLTPFVIGDMGLGFARGAGDNAFGFDFGGGLGMLLFRTSDVQMVVEGKAQVLLSEFEDGDNPWVYSGRLGILF